MRFNHSWAVATSWANVRFFSTARLTCMARRCKYAVSGSGPSFRTLSKAAALAGVRVGYMLGDSSLLAEIEKVVPPFSVNLFARAAAAASLADEPGMRARVDAIVAERNRMARALAVTPAARLSDSHTNFLYLRPKRPAAELFEALLARGILVRRVAGTRTPALRVTVGRPAENDRFLEAWRDVTR